MWPEYRDRTSRARAGRSFLNEYALKKNPLRPYMTHFLVYTTLAGATSVFVAAATLELASGCFKQTLSPSVPTCSKEGTGLQRTGRSRAVQIPLYM